MLLLTVLSKQHLGCLDAMLALTPAINASRAPRARAAGARSSQMVLAEVYLQNAL